MKNKSFAPEPIALGEDASFMQDKTIVRGDVFRGRRFRNAVLEAVNCALSIEGVGCLTNFCEATESCLSSEIISPFLPFITVGPTGSNALYITDGVADEVQINQALATGKNVYLMKGTYTLAGNILMTSGQRLIGAGRLMTIITGGIITSSSRINTIGVESLSCDGIELDCYYCQLVDVRSVTTTNNYGVKFDSASTSGGNHIIRGRYSGLVSGIKYGSTQQDYFIVDFEAYGGVNTIELLGGGYSVDNCFIRNGSATGIYTEVEGMMNNLRIGETPVLIKVFANATNVFGISDGCQISKLILASISTPTNLVQIASASGKTAKVKIDGISGISSGSEIVLTGPGNIRANIRGSDQLLDVSVVGAPGLTAVHNVIKQPEIASSTVPSPCTGMIYLDDGTNTVSTTPGYRRYNGSSWQDL